MTVSLASKIMSTKPILKSPKVLNPEEKLQQSVARDIKLQYLVEHSKKQADALAVAKWEQALYEKDQKVLIKRMNDEIGKDSIAAKVVATTTRRALLQKLYHDDELRFEEELHKKGLAYTTDRM